MECIEGTSEGMNEANQYKLKNESSHVPKETDLTGVKEESQDLNEVEADLYQKCNGSITEEKTVIYLQTEKKNCSKKTRVKKTLTCPKCGTTFTRKWDLKKHTCSVLEKTPPTCLQCGNSFRHQGHLTSHMKIHFGEKPT